MSDVHHANPEIIRAARRALIAGQPVDLGRIAADVGLDRSTIYRQAGRRDDIVADALWSTTEFHAWPASFEEYPPGTPHRVAEVLRSYVRKLIEEPWFRTFLNRDPARALRILTTAEYPLQGRMLVLVGDLIASEPPGPVDLPPAELAFVVVRVAESFIYADLITGGTPDADAAYTVFVALLG